MKDGARFLRSLSCDVLIALLAVSGYMGAAQQEETAAMVSVPVVFETLEAEALIFAEESGKSTLSKEREKALLLLEDVIRAPKASEASVQDALQRKAEIASAMETEARIIATLEAMGFPETGAFCGGRTMTVIVPSAVALDEKARVQIVDAAANAAGLNADCIKIIPQK